MRSRHSIRPRLESLERREVLSTTGAPAAFVGPMPLADGQCHPINARGEGQITSLDRSTGKATTAGTIDDGLLRGSTEFAAQIVDAQGDYSGQTLIVTDHGTVTLTDVGALNADGTFTDHATITHGTGRFAGATGSLVFRGHTLADGVHFLDDSITGSICLDSK